MQQKLGNALQPMINNAIKQKTPVAPVKATTAIKGSIESGEV